MYDANFFIFRNDVKKVYADSLRYRIAIKLLDDPDLTKENNTTLTHIIQSHDRRRGPVAFGNKTSNKKHACCGFLLF